VPANLHRSPGAALALFLILAAVWTPPPGDPERTIADARTSARIRASLLADPLVGGSARADR
jgi:hypothetical protein